MESDMREVNLPKAKESPLRGSIGELGEDKVLQNKTELNTYYDLKGSKGNSKRKV
jgi:hypothetical protein